MDANSESIIASIEKAAIKLREIKTQPPLIVQKEKDFKRFLNDNLSGRFGFCIENTSMYQYCNDEWVFAIQF